MATNKLGKRIISIILSLVMCFSMMQLQAFASTESSPIMPGYYVLGADGSVTGTTTDSSRTQDGFTLSKTIAMGQQENQYDITLTVQTSQTVTTNDAAVVLVVDASNSMSSGRLTAVKNALTKDGGFVDSLTNNSGRIFLAVVSFNANAKTEIGWTELNAENKAGIKQDINGIANSSGTNIEAGLMLARNLLGMSDIAGCSSKYTVLLSDGAPSYYMAGDSTNTQQILRDNNGSFEENYETVYGAIEMAQAVKAKSRLYTICFGAAGTALNNPGAGACTHCGKGLGDHQSGTNRCASDTEYERISRNNRTCRHCGQSANAHVELDDESFCPASTAYTSSGASYAFSTVGEYLKNAIATSAGYAYNADDEAAVNAAFSSIASSASTGMSGNGTKVTDPMGEFIVLGNISGKSGVTASGSTLSWTLDDQTLVSKVTEGNTTTYTYSITYPITLDTAAEGFQEKNPDGTTKYYPTNGYTYLTVNGKKLPFYVPAVSGILPVLPYDVEYYLQGDADLADYGNYTLQETEHLGPVKAWSIVEAPAGYVDKYADASYAFETMEPAQLQVTPGGSNVLRIYYKHIMNAVTVNHFYKTDVVDSAGNITAGTYSTTPNDYQTEAVKAGSTYQATPKPDFGGDRYELQNQPEDLTIVVSATGDNVINLYYSRTVNTYSYKVVYNGNGGVRGDQSVTYNDAENTGEVPDTSYTIYADDNSFNREHYDFIGWNTDPNGNGIAYSPQEAIALTAADSIRTLYAQWAEHPRYSYTLTYDANYGQEPATAADPENADATNVYETSYGFTVDGQLFTREHYDFIGWNTQRDGQGTAYAAGDVLTLTVADNAEVLYAQWAEHPRHSYTLTYDANYGQEPATAADPENASAADVYETSYGFTVDGQLFTREHYDFIGWNTQRDGQGTAYAAGDELTLTVDNNTEVLYAQWAEDPRYSYTLTYDANYGQEPATAADPENADATNVYETSYGFAVDGQLFTREHYTFLGWNTQRDGQGTAYAAGELLTLTAADNAEVLYAQWAEHPRYDYAVYYNANFGLIPAKAADVQNIQDTYDNPYTIHVDNNMFTRENYTFVGWALTPDGPVAYQSTDAITFTASGSITLYAKWVEHEKYSYSVIYNGNGGTLEDGTISYGDQENKADTYKIMHNVAVDANTFVWENHTFIGWNDQPDGSGKTYTVQEIIGLTVQDPTKTLYAQWELDPTYSFALIYDANYGQEPATAADPENADATGIFQTSYGFTVDGQIFNREHYTFLGWNTQRDGQGTAYAAEDILTLTEGNRQAVLYAQWTLNSYSYTVVYEVREDGGEYAAFTGTLPENAPTGGTAPYGTVLDETVLQLPETLSDDVYTYEYTTTVGVTVTEADNVVYVRYTAPAPEDIPDDEPPLVDIPDDEPPLVDIPDEDVPLNDNPHTGDPILLYVGLTALSGIGILALNLKKKKEE